MFRRRHVTFQPAKGKFKREIRPYLRWYERSEMSLAIEVNGAYYRVVTGIQFWRNVVPLKLAVCRENGELEEDAAVTVECIRMVEYLGRYYANRSRMKFDMEEGYKKHEPLVQPFRELIAEVTPQLTDEEREAMVFHRHYLEEMARLTKEIAGEANRLMALKHELESLSEDYIPLPLLHNVMEHFQRWYQLKDETLAIMYEDGERSRPVVWQVLRNSMKTRNTSKKRLIKQIMAEMNGADEAAERFIADERKKTDLPTGEDYIRYLRYEKSLETLLQTHAEVVMKNNWIFSPDKIWN